MKKKTTKTQEAKKILKKKFKVNTKIVFTEDGEVRSIQNNCILVRSAFVVSLKTKILSICIKRYSFQKCVVSISGLSFAKLFSFHLEFNSTGKKRNAEHWPLVTFVCERSLYESCYWLYRTVPLFCLLSSISGGIESLFLSYRNVKHFFCRYLLKLPWILS